MIFTEILQLTICGIAFKRSDQSRPIFSANQPNVNAPIKAPRGTKPPSVDASFDEICVESGVSGDFNSARYGEVQTIKPPIPRDKIFTITDDANWFFIPRTSIPLIKLNIMLEDFSIFNLQKQIKLFLSFIK